MGAQTLITLFSVAMNFIGEKEVSGAFSNPLVLAMLRMDNSWVEDDSTAWCSAFINFLCKILGVQRTKSLAARSWLTIGQSIPLAEAQRGYDIVVLKRGKGKQPGPEVIAAPGHVGLYAGHDDDHVQLLGGNQGDSVSIASFPKESILGIRRIA